mgnify:CR=1 FL=1
MSTTADRLSRRNLLKGAAAGTGALALASCAPGIVTVNIDNGYGAACAALRVLGLNGTAGGLADSSPWREWARSNPD